MRTLIRRLVNRSVRWREPLANGVCRWCYELTASSLESLDFDQAAHSCSGIQLIEDRPLNIEHQFLFSEYTGDSGRNFGLGVYIYWRFGGESLTHTVTINQEAIADLEVFIRYSELEDGTVDKDMTVAKIGTHIMWQIVSLPAG